MPILYEVNAEFVDPTIADDWVRWILTAHLADVVKAGASGGRLVRVDGEDGVPRFSVQYEFATRGGLETYLRDHAGRLRNEGTSRFPLDKVQYSRRTGEILALQ